MGIIGYGSLMSPYCLVSSIDERIDSKKDIYSERRIKGESVISEECRKTLKSSYKERIDFTPIKLKGFLRTYTYISERGGTMLEAHHTNKDKHTMNCILIRNLTEEEIQKIEDIEHKYKKLDVKSSSIEVYGEGEIPDNESHTIFVSKKNSISTESSALPRNPTYHSRILKGIGYLEKEYSKKVKDSFEKDFLTTTFEHPHHELNYQI